jgi:biopolymer transport protein ExbD
VKIKTSKSEKIETQMAPMIDVVFQLLIFFMLTLKIVEPEGDFSINMPIGAPSEPTNELPLPDLKVRMLSDDNGNLTDLQFGTRSLGTAPDCFRRLTNEIIKVTGNPLPGDVPNEQQVEIDADYNLRYEYGIACIGACTGQIQDGKMIRYIEKIKFSQVREPEQGVQ